MVTFSASGPSLCPTTQPRIEWGWGYFNHQIRQWLRSLAKAIKSEIHDMNTSRFQFRTLYN